MTKFEITPLKYTLLTTTTFAICGYFFKPPVLNLLVISDFPIVMYKIYFYYKLWILQMTFMVICNFVKLSVRQQHPCTFGLMDTVRRYLVLSLRADERRRCWGRERAVWRGQDWARLQLTQRCHSPAAAPSRSRGWLRWCTPRLAWTRGSIRCSTLCSNLKQPQKVMNKQTVRLYRLSKLG